MKELDVKQQSIVIVAGSMARGDMARLAIALNAGLDAGLTVNELKEVLVQLYAYCGFPRSLNGIVALMGVLEERKAKVIQDVMGKDASVQTDAAVQTGAGDKYEVGKNTLEILTRRPEAGPKTGAAAFAPVIDTFLKEHLFADIFSRDVLSYAQRELATIAALSSMEGVEPQLKAHQGMGLNVGLTEAQLAEVTDLIQI